MLGFFSITHLGSCLLFLAVKCNAVEIIIALQKKCKYLSSILGAWSATRKAS